MTQLEYDTEYAALVARLGALQVNTRTTYLPESDAMYRSLERLELWFEVAVDALDKRFMSEDA